MKIRHIGDIVGYRKSEVFERAVQKLSYADTHIIDLGRDLFKLVFPDDDTGPRLQRSSLSKVRTDDDGNFTLGN